MLRRTILVPPGYQRAFLSPLIQAGQSSCWSCLHRIGLSGIFLSLSKWSVRRLVVTLCIWSF